ncbi:MAG: hypothetical protein Crog4KO_34640 [Crocinitomicaceae bacterium]
MAKHIISVDAGNGGTNAVLQQKKGIKTNYFPSVRASATGDSLGLGEQFELSYEYVDWGAHRYVFGDDVLNISRKGIERHQGAFRYGDEFHQFLATVAIGQLGIKSGSVDLTMFAPPGMFQEAQESIKERFSKNGSSVGIKFKSDKKPRIWSYDTITVYPEGIGAAACFALDANGEALAESDVLSGDTVILDMGMYTLDALQMSNGNFNPESLGTATWEGQGIKAHLLDPILRVVKKQSDDFALLTIDDIDAVIRQGIATNDYTLRVAGLEVNLKSAVDKYAERYAEWVSNNIIDGVFNGLRGFKSAILVGGGATLTQNYMSKWYNDKVLRFDQYAETKTIDPVFANAIGGIRLAQMRLK